MTSEEDTKLNTLAERYHHDWMQIAVFFPGKTHLQLKRRWEKLQNPDLKRSKWTPEEDELLLSLYSKWAGSGKPYLSNSLACPECYSRTTSTAV